MQLDIFTITSGREDYLPRQLSILKANRNSFRRHIFVLNGFAASPGTLAAVHALGSEVVWLQRRHSTGGCIEKIKESFTSSHVLKLDDDAIPLGDFFRHLHAVIDLIPDKVFSPFPVGLVGLPGGPKIIEGAKREVVYSPETDTHYTLRPVVHVGGFARVAPSACYRMLSFDPAKHNEDVEFSTAMNNRRVPMCYLENALVIEHAETTLGQRARNAAYQENVIRWRKESPPSEVAQADLQSG